MAYKPGAQIANADGLSRLPLPITSEVLPVPAELVHLMEHMALTPISVMELKRKTGRDLVLSRVQQLVCHGWSDDTEIKDDGLVPYERRKHELSVLEDCVMWESRVIIPKKCQTSVLMELHQCHLGISKMKSLARSYVW